MNKSKKLSVRERLRLLKFWKHMSFAQMTYGLKHGHLDNGKLREILRKLEKKENETK